MQIIKRLKKAFILTQDLVKSLDDKSFSLHLGDLPSNTIGEQLWCMVGAQESYIHAFEKGSWQGFQCSLKKDATKTDILEALEQSLLEIAALETPNEDTMTESQEGILFDLLEHEVQHHGQLIRYIYANKLAFPESWNKRYTV